MEHISNFLYQELVFETYRRKTYEGFPEWDGWNPVLVSDIQIPKNPLNYYLVEFLTSWKEYLKMASKNFRKTGSKCGICTAYSTWLGQKSGGIIESVAMSEKGISSLTDFLNLKGCRTGKFSAFIVGLKFNWLISKKEWKLLEKEKGGPHFNMYFREIHKNTQNYELLTILRTLLLSRSHLP